jgi:hypothetical protein
MSQEYILKIHHLVFSMAIAIALPAAHSAPSPPIKGGTCWAAVGMKSAPDSSTEFTCEILGKVTIGQIYEKGYRVVTMLMNPRHPDVLSLIIEEQR